MCGRTRFLHVGQSHGAIRRRSHRWTWLIYLSARLPTRASPVPATGGRGRPPVDCARCTSGLWPTSVTPFGGRVVDGLCEIVR